MPTIQSKLSPITTTCIEYVHPWTQSCSIATAGLILQAAQDSIRLYTIVYTLSLFTKGRLPNLRDIKRTICGIIQSSAFLTTSAFSFCLFLCVTRKCVGSFNFFTAAYVPAFMSSLCAILIERASRRNLLSLYVANVSTETLFRMAVSRHLITPINNGQIYIFGVCTSIILYYYRLGLHHQHTDSIFDIIRFVIGNGEEKKTKVSCEEQLPHNAADENNELLLDEQNNKIATSSSSSSSSSSLSSSSSSSKSSSIITFLLNIQRKYFDKLKQLKKHKECPHENSCVSYFFGGGCKLFGVGLSLQITLKLLFQLKSIVNRPANIFKLLLNLDTLKFGIFLGGFSAIFRSCSCLLRHLTNTDKSYYAIPSCLIASIAFKSYPDTTIALYVMWKMFQITYNIGAANGVLPKVPGFILFLYCASTAVLFHAAILEPSNLRPSYWKFLHSLSGGRVAGMDRKPLDVWGLETSKQLADVLARTKTNLQISFKL